MDLPFAEGDGTAAKAPAGGLTFADVDMTPIRPALILAAAGGHPDDGIPRPPYDPLNTGQKLAGVLDAGASIGGGFFAMNRFRDDGLHVLRADVNSLDKLIHTPELHEFRSLGSSLENKVSKMADAAQGDVLSMQSAKPHLFEDFSNRGTWKGLNLKMPKYSLMNDVEKGVLDRSGNLEYISQSLRRGVNTTSTPNFKSGLANLHNLDRNPVAISEGLAPELRQLEDLGLKVNSQVAESTISMAAESKAVLFKNAGIIGAGLATNFVIEKTLLKDSSPKALTIAADCASPFIVLSELPLWAKFSVIVGAHAVSRLAEYGMSK